MKVSLKAIYEQSFTLQEHHETASKIITSLFLEIQFHYGFFLSCPVSILAYDILRLRRKNKNLLFARHFDFFLIHISRQ